MDAFPSTLTAALIELQRQVARLNNENDVAAEHWRLMQQRITTLENRLLQMERAVSVGHR